MPHLEEAVRSLTEASTETTRSIQGLEKALKDRTKALWAAVIASFVVVVALAGVMLYSHLQVEHLQQKMCPLVTSIIPRPGDTLPPSGPEGDRGREVIARFTALAKDFGCAHPASPLPRPPSEPTSITPPPTFRPHPEPRSTQQ